MVNGVGLRKHDRPSPSVAISLINQRGPPQAESPSALPHQLGL